MYVGRVHVLNVDERCQVWRWMEGCGVRCGVRVVSQLSEMIYERGYHGFMILKPHACVRRLSTAARPDPAAARALF